MIDITEYEFGKNNIASNSLPYVEAFVAETLRCSSMIYMGVQRTAVKDTNLQGYFIPKVVIVYELSFDPSMVRF